MLGFRAFRITTYEPRGLKYKPGLCGRTPKAPNRTGILSNILPEPTSEAVLIRISSFMTVETLPDRTDEHEGCLPRCSDSATIRRHAALVDLERKTAASCSCASKACSGNQVQWRVKLVSGFPNAKMDPTPTTVQRHYFDISAGLLSKVVLALLAAIG